MAVSGNMGAGILEQDPKKQEASRYPGASGPIGREQVQKAYDTYKRYDSGLQEMITKIVNAEEWWKSKHWERFKTKSQNENDPKPVSAWLFNSIINKHADFMDNYPCPAILPREESDEETAQTLSAVVPVILERNGYEKTYTECAWDKPKVGTAVYTVLWDKSMDGGLGDIRIGRVDLMNIRWEPGIENIQESRNIFVTKIVDLDRLKEEYPFIGDKVRGGVIDKPKYIYQENINMDGKVTVFDWYYKRRKRLENGGMKEVLHYCKFVGDVVLYATENDPKTVDSGWYDHGLYPFVFDVLFPEKGSPAGFGYLDVMVNPQEYVDKLDQVILKNAILNRPRYFASNAVAVDLNEFADLSKDLISVNGDVDDTRLKQIQVPQISDIVSAQRDAKINEIKETSGNRDFSQGSTTSGVTAASAIAALQEAGSKLSRDMLKSTYFAHAEVVTMVIELIRQFYDLPRCFRITRENGIADYVALTNANLKIQEEPMMTGDDISMRRPVFDIKVSAQKASPYSRLAQNEFAKELFGMGLFNPQIADQALAVLRMMDFDRREEVMKTVEQNGTMYQQIQQMKVTMQQMAAMIARFSGDTRILDAMQASGMMEGMPMTDIEIAAGQVQTDSLGRPVGADNSQAGKARQKAAQATEVR